MINNMPERRRGKLKKLIAEKPYLRVMEAECGLMGLIVENTRVEDKEYDAIWISSLCDSTLKGKPDNEVVDFSSRLQTIEEVMEVTSKPVIVDGDTGGRTEYFISHVKTLERMGVSAVIIEDKTGLKQNSLMGEKAVHSLEDKEIFAEKISRGKRVLQTEDFMIIARIESFIAGRDLAEACDRAKAYVEAGADGIMIHSYKKGGEEIQEFLRWFQVQYPKVPAVVVPTAYCHFTEKQLQEMGAKIIIYANHLLRSAYPIMKKVAEEILKNGRSEEVSTKECASMQEILSLIQETE